MEKSYGISDNSVFKGSIPYPEMPRWFSAADIYVSTSPTDGDHPALMESMMCGSFPVVTDIDANQEWVKDGENGLLFIPRNPSSLADRIIGFIPKK